jgi:hypothetical protein
VIEPLREGKDGSIPAVANLVDDRRDLAGDVEKRCGVGELPR